MVKPIERSDEAARTEGAEEFARSLTRIEAGVAAGLMAGMSEDEIARGLGLREDEVSDIEADLLAKVNRHRGA